MSEQKHTPGPWRLHGDGYSTGWPVVLGPDTNGSIAVCDQENMRSREERIANARLIAVAPELLEALKRFIVLDEFGNQMDQFEYELKELTALDAARAAIAKATL